MYNLEEIKAGVTGPIASICTPFLKDGSINFPGLKRYIDVSIDGGAKTVLLTSGDSLFMLMTDDEIAEVTRYCAECIVGRALFLAATDTWWTGKAVEFARYARELGAAGLLLSPPTWGPTIIDNLVDHYAAVAEEIPVFVLSGAFNDIGEQAALMIVKGLLERVPKVVGMKHDYTAEFGQKACRMAGGRWTIFSGGQKQTHMLLYPYGCDAYMSMFITLKPSISHEYWSAIQAKDISRAAKVIRELDAPFVELLLSLPEGFDAGFHAAAELLGIYERWRRKPFANLNEEGMERLADFLKEKAIL